MRLLHACERVRVADLPCVSIGRHARVLSEAGTRPGPATRRQPAGTRKGEKAQAPAVGADRHGRTSALD